SSDKARSDYDDEVAKNRLANVITEIEANTASTVEKAKAFGPEIIAALNAFSSREMAIEACKAMAPVALTHGTSVVGVLETLLEGTVLSSGMGDIQNMLGGLKKQSTLSHDDED
ncbi:hypothetical protein KAR91_11200, partial [Candidatus Pacearchaeota archaeon]|nr:hypothetical protein [Candidatus Pacearchaeota archaeon]